MHQGDEHQLGHSDLDVQLHFFDYAGELCCWLKVSLTPSWKELFQGEIIELKSAAELWGVENANE